MYFQLLGHYLLPLRLRVIVLGSLLLVQIGLMLGSPQILRLVLDGATSGASLNTLIIFTSGYILLELAAGGLKVWSTYEGEQIAWLATNSLRSDLTEHVLGLDLSFHKEKTPGELIERIDGDVTSLALFFSQFVLIVLFNIVLLAGVLVVLFAEDWRIGLAFLFFSVLAAGVMFGLRNFAVPHLRSVRQISGELFGFLEERLAGTEDIRSSGAGAFMVSRQRQLATRFLGAERWARFALVTIWSASTPIFTLGNAAALAVSGWLYMNGLATVGTVYLVFVYSDMLSRPLTQLSQQIQELQRATAAILRIRDLLAIKPTIVDGDHGPPPAGPLSVEFNHVTFGYSDDEAVLNDVSFRIEAGDTVGVVGRTGSGKSTIARLLFRFYDPQEGTVEIGGVDARDLNVNELRSRIALVTQDVQLFAASVRDNLTFFRDDIPDEKLDGVLRDLGLGDWLDSLPDGLNSELGSGGGGVSAGEGQLIALARAFLRDPSIAILDEASSRLDPASEQYIERAIGQLLTDRTAIIIAHRLATIDRCNRVIVMDAGQVVEAGNRMALAANPRSRLSALLSAGLEVVA